MTSPSQHSLEEVVQNTLPIELDSLFTHFVDTMLQLSQRRLQEADMLRGKVLNSKESEASNQREKFTPYESLIKTIESLNSQIGIGKESVRHLSQKNEARLTASIKEMEARLKKINSRRDSLVKTKEDMESPRVVYAFIHPVRKKENDFFRLVLPVTQTDLFNVGTTGEALFGTLYTEILKDPQLGAKSMKGAMRHVIRTPIQMPSQRVYNAIDFDFAIDESMHDIMDYISSLSQGIVNHNGEGFASDEDIRRANPLFQRPNLELSVIKSPLGYSNEVNEAIKSIEEGKSEFRLALQTFLESTLGDKRELSDSEIDVALASPINLDHRRKIREESSNRAKQLLIDGLNVKGEDYALVPTQYSSSMPEPLSTGTVSNEYLIDGRRCISLDTFMDLKRLNNPKVIEERGFQTGALTKIEHGGRIYLPLDEVLQTGRVYVSNHGAVCMFDEEVTPISEFSNKYGFRSSVVREAIKSGELTEEDGAYSSGKRPIFYFIANRTADAVAMKLREGEKK